jgi:predicted secreted protein
MAFTGKGTIFNRYNTGTSAYEPIANINSISGPSSSRETVDVTTLDSEGGYREFIGSLRDAGDISLSMNFDKDTYALMKTDYESDTIQKYQIVLPDTDNTTFEFEGLVTELPVEIPLDDKVTADISIKISGETDVTTVDIVASVAAQTGINVANATQLADVSLPANVTVTYADATTEALDVVWDAGTPIYDGGTAGTYVFAGTITMEDGIINPNGVKASVSVVVAGA